MTSGELLAAGVAERAAEVSTPAQVLRWAEVRPQSVAIAYSGNVLTYAELCARSSRLAAVLRAHGIGRGSIVALALDRSAELVVAALAVWLAGGAYLGIDMDDPEVRMAGILADSGASVVVTRAATARRFAGGTARVLAVEDAADEPGQLLEHPQIAPEDPCYLTYTSGSTGVPKGVLVPHRGLANLVGWYVPTFGVRPGERMTQLARPSFDAWALEVWPCLAGGATLCLVDGGTVASPPDFLRWLADKSITICFMTTALAVEMFDQPWSAHELALRVLLLGGEKLYRHPPAGLPGRVFNLYGPTEASVVSTCSTLFPGTKHATAPSIGRPLPGVRAYVLDSDRRPVPHGAVGELHIGGVGVALGYLNRPELTVQRFVPDPFFPGDGGCMYATGDLVRRLDDGSLDFVGRADGQVKLRGFRIELGEVELALNQLAEVREAVAVKQADAERLVGYVVLADATRSLGSRELRQALGQRLPDYMIPHACVVLDALPLTPHGKVDRENLAARALPAQPGSAAGGDACGDGTVGGDLERLIAELWSEVLEIGSIGREDSFFDLGGDSLQAMRFVSRARERGLRLGAESLFEHEVLHELASSIQPTLSEKS